MRLAVIADVHSNLAALEAVMGSVEREGADAVVCLGDVVGYNAEPGACVERVRELAGTRTVLGNHDVASCRDLPPLGTSSSARAVQEWTRGRLAATHKSWLDGLPRRLVDPSGFVAVHGCFINETHYNGYVTGTMLEENLQAIATREEWPKLGLCGHTHAPMCGWIRRGALEERRLHEPVDWPDNAEAVLLNPGSVGQPRDGDPRAAWLFVDTGARRALLHRVAYDLERTLRAIRGEGLPEEHALRLQEGR